MLLKEIELTNIGPYEGTNKFDFDTKSKKNIVLIGGKNGSGKTTLLNSVRLALYGPLAYGYRTHSQGYISKINSLFNNNAKNKKNNFYIKLGFTIVDDFKRVYIELIRNWKFTDSMLKEKVEIFKNNVQLNELEKEDFLEKLRVTLPPSLLELCFFDGEDITKLSNEDHLSNYLRELSSKLFNLDLFQSLEDNLSKYLSESSKTQQEKQLENEKNNLELVLSKKVNELKTVKSKIDTLRDKLNVTKENYKNTKELFSIHGGLFFEERENIQKEILNIENDRRKTNEDIKEFIAKELPFFLAFPVLKKLINQLEKEEVYYISDIVEERLRNISFKKIEEVINAPIDAQKEQEIFMILKKELVVSDDITVIHNASKTETNQVNLLSSQIKLSRLRDIIKLINKNTEDLNKLSKLKKKLKDNEQTSEFNEMITSMENDTKKISNLEVELRNCYELKDILHDEIDRLNKQYDKTKKELHNLYKRKSSYDVTKKIITISRKFQKEQLRKKVRDIEYFSTKMLKDLMRKQNFIHRINIDHETFHLTLIDQENNKINKDILSAGEKELLVLSIIWGTIHSSNKQIPIVLDTLLGRLDLEHKSSVINKLIPRFGEQCIILATNSEITEDLFSELSPFISNHFTLKYDTTNKNTKIENHFFNSYIKGEISK